MNYFLEHSEKSILFLFFFCYTLFSNPVFGQGWTHVFYISPIGTTAHSSDGPYLPAFQNGRIRVPGHVFNNTQSMYYFRNITEDTYRGWSGQSNPPGSGTESSHIVRASLTFPSDSILVLEEYIDETSGLTDLYLTRFYPFLAQGSGTEMISLDWFRPLFQDTAHSVGASAMINTPDGNVVVLGTTQSEEFDGEQLGEILLLKSDLQANVIWSTVLPFPGDDRAVQVVAADDGYWLLKNTSTSPWLIKTDILGNLNWEIPLNEIAEDEAHDMILATDGSLVITGQNAANELYVLKTDQNGATIWRRDYSGTLLPESAGNALTEDFQGDLLVAGEIISSETGSKEAALLKLTTSGIPLWERTYNPTFHGEVFKDITLMPSGQYLMSGHLNWNSTSQPTGEFFAKTDTLGLVNGGRVQGNVFHDFDFDCEFNNGDSGPENWIIQVTNDSLSFFGRTDEEGNYRVPVFTPINQSINYEVSVRALSNYWEVCENDIPITIEYLDTVLVDFALQPLVDCPIMEVNISDLNFRLCDTTQVYISYCNNGTNTAEEASVIVSLPEELSFLSASPAPSEITDSTYVFQLGDLGIDDCGVLVISAIVTCDEELLGNTACVQAQIFPDTICMVPGANWSGALLEASYSCIDGNIQFQIENIGNAEMTTPLQYVIIEDAVLLLEGSFDLDPEQSVLPDLVPDNGSTYTLIAPQEQGAPGATLLSIGAESCLSHGGNLTEYDQNNGNPFEETQCGVIVGAYDPNDKQAMPSGFGEDHGLFSDTDLQYTIRFQNTGTDTAFRVIIRDQLSPQLDPTGFRPLAASHPYSWRFEDRTLVFNFYDIALPDSTTNLAESQGFVSFRIRQALDLPAETRIENTAEIYFDFNSPVITNTTFHTIKRFIDILSNTVVLAEPASTITVAPNPILQGAWIRLEGASQHSAPTLLRVFDMNGREVKRLQSQQASFWFDKGQLAAGMYVFRMEQAGRWLASGKLMVQ